VSWDDFHERNAPSRGPTNGAAGSNHNLSWDDVPIHDSNAATPLRAPT
jgi:hypothetical protein